MSATGPARTGRRDVRRACSRALASRSLAHEIKVLETCCIGVGDLKWCRACRAPHLGEAPEILQAMRLRIFTEPQQGADYETLLRVARATEDCGFEAFFRSDHYLKMGGVSGLPGPTDAWVTLAGLARETSRIRLGTLMTAATFRLPGPLAISVATVDAMSAGRVDLGIGTGWYEEEHTAYG